MSRLSSAALKLIPKSNHHLFEFCRQYVDNFNGQNNSDINTNGEKKLLRQILPESRIVFDVGANVGEWTDIALTIKPTLQIHCFEPSKSTYARLLKKEFPANIICNNTGLGSTEERRDLYVFQETSRLNSIYRRNGLENKNITSPTLTETIKLETLDSYCSRHNIDEIDYLKLDIEGHELEALKGASRMLSNKMIKAIQIEYGGCNIDARVLLKDFFELFALLPYRFYKIYPHDIRMVERYSQTLENFQYQNWVILREY